MLNAECVLTSQRHEVAHDLLAVVGEHALGMELHAFDGESCDAAVP